MADYDAIVCGGGSKRGPAAIRLAEAGWSVCLLEANDDLGGAARTLESTLPGFKHDFGAAFFPLVAPSPSIVGRDLAPYGLRFVHAQVPSAHPFPGNQAIALGRSAAETAASIDKVHLGDGAAWFALDEAFGPVMKHFLRAQMQRWPFEELAKVVGRLRLSGGLQFARMVVSGVSAVADRFESGQARAFITGPAMHADLQPEEPGTGVYALLLSMLGQRFGMPVVEGGTGMITAALEAKARGDGVEILTGRRVDRIVVERGRAVAVEAGGGGGRVPPRGPGVPGGGPPGGPAGEAAHGLLPPKPTLILGQQSLADPSRAPAGKHTLWGYAHVPAVPTGDAGRPGDEVSWDRSSEAFLERMEAGIEAHAPGFRDRVLARRAWSPVDLEAADASLAGGDISAGSFAVDQQLLFRPGPSWWRWGTPVKGLYLAGASVPPGAGVHGACGDLAARQALADHDRPRLLAMTAAGAGAAAAAVFAGRRAAP